MTESFNEVELNHPEIYLTILTIMTGSALGAVLPLIYIHGLSDVLEKKTLSSFLQTIPHCVALYPIPFLGRQQLHFFLLIWKWWDTGLMNGACPSILENLTVSFYHSEKIIKWTHRSISLVIQWKRFSLLKPHHWPWPFLPPTRDCSVSLFPPALQLSRQCTTTSCHHLSWPMICITLITLL